MMKIDKYVTIDIEGDNSSKFCREDFTENTLYRDPDTIMWLCSFYDGIGHEAYGIRLHPIPRHYYSPVKGIIESTMEYHEQTNVFPSNVKDCGSCINAEDYRKFLLNIAEKINYYSKNHIPVFFKGYKQIVKGILRSDAYDREVIGSLMKKYSIDCNTNCLIDVNDCFPNFWMKPTHSQKGQRTDNQSWMNNGIRHNLEDSKNLWEAIHRRKQQYRQI